MARSAVRSAKNNVFSSLWFRQVLGKLPDGFLDDVIRNPAEPAVITDGVVHFICDKTAHQGETSSRSCAPLFKILCDQGIELRHRLTAVRTFQRIGQHADLCALYEFYRAQFSPFGSTCARTEPDLTNAILATLRLRGFEKVRNERVIGRFSKEDEHCDCTLLIRRIQRTPGAIEGEMGRHVNDCHDLELAVRQLEWLLANAAAAVPGPELKELLNLGDKIAIWNDNYFEGNESINRFALNERTKCLARMELDRRAAEAASYARGGQT